MITTTAGQALIKSFESRRLSAYADSGGRATIGWGTITYPSGQPVLMGDTCTEEQAEEYFQHDLQRFEIAVDALIGVPLTPSQFDALVSFSYNLGKSALAGSTLRTKVNADSHDPTIRGEFMKWHLVQGQPVLGLWRRRHAEADTYFGTTTPCPPMG